MLSHSSRKADHIRINLEEDVAFPNLTTGLERFHFIHQALPELNLGEVETGLTLFGRRLSAPILVSSMTGGTERAGMINRRLAEASQQCRVAIGVGSQRAALEEEDLAASFRMREYAPDALIFANLGAVQLNYGYTVEHCQRAVDMLEADALILHLNPLQEVLQAEGDYNWRGVLAQIETVCRHLPVPVIAKEVGWGISREAARLLINAGVRAIDVAGAGGTSWSEVEMHRAPTERLRRLAGAFADWGLPTATSLLMARQVREEMGLAPAALPLFASGGMRTGQDIAKSVALGADLVGLASPFLKRVMDSTEAVIDEMETLTEELRIVMFCAGAKDLAALRRPGLLISAGELYVRP